MFMLFARPMFDINKDRGKNKNLNIVIEYDERKHDKQIEAHNNRFTEVNDRFTEVNDRFTEVDDRFTEVNGHFRKNSDRFTKVDDRDSEQDGHLTKLDSQIEAHDELFGLRHRKQKDYDENQDVRINKAQDMCAQALDQLARLNEKEPSKSCCGYWG